MSQLDSKFKKYHYTYKITELSTGRMYIGVRSSNITPEKDIGIYYFSSSTDNEFMKRQFEFPEDYIYEVLNVFENRNDANLDEIELHNSNRVASSNSYINKVNSYTGGFCTFGKAVVKDAEGNISLCNMDDPRYLSGELVGAAKGLIPVINIETLEGGTATKNDPDYINGLLVHVTKYKVVVKDKNGKNMQVSIYDPRYLSGELISIHKGKISVKDKNGKVIKVDKDDPRYLSGELVHIWKNKITVKDKYGKNMMVDNDDPRFLSGELVGVTKNLLTVTDSDGKKTQVTSDEYKKIKTKSPIHTKNKTVVKDEDGNIFSVDVNDPRFLSGELSGIAKGKLAVKDALGNRSMIYTNDERYNVSLFPASGKIYMIEGKLYSASTAAKKFNVSRYIVLKRASSDEWENWVEII